MSQPNTISTFLWFKPGQLDEAVALYRSIFTDFEVDGMHRFEDGTTFVANFRMCGQNFTGMSAPGGPDFNDAVSISVSVDGQAEVDRLWGALTADGGEPGQCGWLRDRFGVSWQVVPIQMGAHLGNPDSAKREYAQQQLMKMTKIVINDFVRQEQQ